MKRLYPSKSKVMCKKPGCGVEVRKDRMPDHLKKIHGDTSGNIEGQQMLSTFFHKYIEEIEETTQFHKNAETAENEVVEVFSELLGSEKRVNAQKRDKSLDTETGVGSVESQEGAKCLALQEFEVREIINIS